MTERYAMAVRLKEEKRDFYMIMPMYGLKF